MAITGGFLETRSTGDFVGNAAGFSGSLLIDGMMSAREAFERLGLSQDPASDDFNTLAGYMIFQLGRIPTAGDAFEADGWHFEVVDMDGRRIDKVLAIRTGAPS